MNNRRPGRPVGKTDARERILEVARTRFLRSGYVAVTMRAVAADAGVDSALIAYYFGSKSGLFGAVLGLPANPPQLLASQLVGPLGTLAQRIVRAAMAAWSDPAAGPLLRSMVEAAVHDDEFRQLFAEMVHTEIVGRLGERLGAPRAEQRAAVVASQLVGMLFSRYVLRVEPLASASSRDVERMVCPPMQLAITGTVRRAVGG